jgi:hypothetical protein
LITNTWIHGINVVSESNNNHDDTSGGNGIEMLKGCDWSYIINGDFSNNKHGSGIVVDGASNCNVKALCILNKYGIDIISEGVGNGNEYDLIVLFYQYLMFYMFVHLHLDYYTQVLHQEAVQKKHAAPGGAALLHRIKIPSRMRRRVHLAAARVQALGDEVGAVAADFIERCIARVAQKRPSVGIGHGFLAVIGQAHHILRCPFYECARRGSARKPGSESILQL